MSIEAMSYFETYSDEQLSRLYTELNTTEELIKNDVQHLKRWLEMQPHLPNIEGT